VQADYCNSLQCYTVLGKDSRSTLALVIQNIVEALYVYAEAVKLLIIHTESGKFSEYRTPEIISAGFSGII